MPKCKKCNSKGYVYVEVKQKNAPETYLPTFTSHLEKVKCECNMPNNKKCLICGSPAKGTVELKYYLGSKVETSYRHVHLCHECLQNIDQGMMNA